MFPKGTWSGYVHHGVILQTGQRRVYERNGGLRPRYVCGPEDLRVNCHNVCAFLE